MLIDCDTCTVRDIACDDCVVGVLLGTPTVPARATPSAGRARRPAAAGVRSGGAARARGPGRPRAHPAAAAGASGGASARASGRRHGGAAGPGRGVNARRPARAGPSAARAPTDRRRRVRRAEHGRLESAHPPLAEHGAVGSGWWPSGAETSGPGPPRAGRPEGPGSRLCRAAQRGPDDTVVSPRPADRGARRTPPGGRGRHRPSSPCSGPRHGSGPGPRGPRGPTPSSRPEPPTPSRPSPRPTPARPTPRRRRWTRRSSSGSAGARPTAPAARPTPPARSPTPPAPSATVAFGEVDQVSRAAYQGGQLDPLGALLGSGVPAGLPGPHLAAGHHLRGEPCPGPALPRRHRRRRGRRARRRRPRARRRAFGRRRAAHRRRRPAPQGRRRPRGRRGRAGPRGRLARDPGRAAPRRHHELPHRHRRHRDRHRGAEGGADPAGQALRVGRHRAEHLRLLRAGAVGLPPGRGRAAAGVAPAGPDRHPGVLPGRPARRPAVLQRAPSPTSASTSATASSSRPRSPATSSRSPRSAAASPACGAWSSDRPPDALIDTTVVRVTRSGP